MHSLKITYNTYATLFLIPHYITIIDFLQEQKENTSISMKLQVQINIILAKLFTPNRIRMYLSLYFIKHLPQSKKRCK